MKPVNETRARKAYMGNDKQLTMEIRRLGFF